MAEVRGFVWHKLCKVNCPEMEVLARRVEEALSAVYFGHHLPSVEDRDV